MSKQAEATAQKTPDGLPEFQDAEELSHDLKRIMVHSEKALVNGDARENIEQLERWIESYRRGLSAAHKISNNGLDLLSKAREQLNLALEERLRLEGEGGNPPVDKSQVDDLEELTRTIKRIDRLIEIVEHCFIISREEQSSQTA